jgi:N-acyl homoserine lactone hydrolase
MQGGICVRAVAGRCRTFASAGTFGHGSVVILDVPGHRPGHHGLLVKLARMGLRLLSGDAAHCWENLIWVL